MTNFTRGRITVVVGGQFGSEGKGAVAGWVGREPANEGREVLGVRVGGPNAGHTVYGRCPHAIEICGKCNEFGHPWALRQVPVLAVTNPEAGLIIAAGSEVDPDVLHAEILELNAAGYNVLDRLVVDANATLLLESHRAAEAGKELQKRLGSTAKGIGGARVDRLWREARTVGLHGGVPPENYGDPDVSLDTLELMERCLAEGGHVVIEGTQGYGLGLHTEYYPFTTSGDCRAIDFLAQAGLSPWALSWRDEEYRPDLKVIVCFRPFPIRVAGNSGPMGTETSWEELGLPKEFTTVTRKVRRVAAWDPRLVEAAIRANGGLGSHMVLALTMADHVIPELAGVTDLMKVHSEQDKALYRWIFNAGLFPQTESFLWRGLSNGQTLLGTGPTTMLGDLEN
jgi:adenylosuccinate synthase